MLCLLAGCRDQLRREAGGEFTSGRSDGIVVVDGRRAVDESGAARSQEPLWTADTTRAAPAPSIPHRLRLTGKPSIVIVFVHGYNVTAAEALEQSKVLWKHIRESNEHIRAKGWAVPETNSLEFLAFLWRGNFGEKRFPTAQRSAAITASAFADFLRTVVKEAGGARTLILTHSLGAEVALEALRIMRESSATPVADCLILVQGAVPAYSVYRWRVSYQQLPGAGDKMRPEQVDQCGGRYADAIQMTKHFVYTLSTKDKVLWNQWEMAPFELSERFMPLTQPCQLPVWPGSGGTVVRVTALGSSFNTKDRGEVIPPSKLYQSPSARNARQGFHPFQILPAGSIVFQYTDFRIDHTRVDRRDISTAQDSSDSGRFRGHSVLFTEAGLPVVEDLWELALSSWH